MPPSTSGLSARLAEHVAGVRFEQLPPTTIAATCRALLDAAGVMHAASGMVAEVRPFIELAAADGGRPAASILGTGHRTSAEMAALANGAMAHALDYEDALDTAPVHPNASLVPAVIALAQAHGPVSGAELVTAIAVGCDLTCRLAVCLREDPARLGWYPPPILGAMGAVAGAARLLRLSPRQVLDAWSLMLLQNSCSGEITRDADTVLRAVREAFPAHAAVMVTRLAAAGIPGFSAPFEGEAGFFRLFAAGRYDVQVLLQDLGSRWYIDQLSFKPWPSCRGTHAAIESALHLRAHHDIKPRQIAGVAVRGGQVQRMLAEPAARKQAPATSIDAKFSLPFTVATALCHGAVNLDSFGAPARDNPAVLALTPSVGFEVEPGWDHAPASGGVRIRMRDGRELETEFAEPLGSPGRPLGEDQLVDKFVDCLGRAMRPIPPAAARSLAGRILAMAQEPDAGVVLQGA
ncbi:MAG TPA: MmgE/PrpD family protein [Steroidobacteraceae bacterium]|nr:MmgE/PrpD family protein [Steroidobacteraceae bacterium]